MTTFKKKKKDPTGITLYLVSLLQSFHTAGAFEVTWQSLWQVTLKSLNWWVNPLHPVLVCAPYHDAQTLRSFTVIKRLSRSLSFWGEDSTLILMLFTSAEERQFGLHHWFSDRSRSAARNAVALLPRLLAFIFQVFGQTPWTCFPSLLTSNGHICCAHMLSK